MELAQLLYFREVVLEENISRAAEKLYISQPALSNAIARLENDVGAELIERRGNRIVITAAGKRFAEHIDKALREIDLGVVNARRISNENYSIASVAYTTFSAVDMLKQFLGDAPKEKIMTTLASRDDVRKMVQKREADFGILWGDISGPHILCETAMCGKLYAVINKMNPLSQKSSVTLRELRDENIICSRVGLTKEVVTQFFVNAGISANISDIMAGQERDMLDDMSKINIGVCFVVLMEELNSRLGELKNIKCVPVKDVNDVRLCMIRRDDSFFTENVQRLYDFAMDYFKQNGKEQTMR